MKSIEMVAKTLDDTGHFGGWNLDICWHRVSLTFTNEPPSRRRHALTFGNVQFPLVIAHCSPAAASRQRVPRSPVAAKPPPSKLAVRHAGAEGGSLSCPTNRLTRHAAVSPHGGCTAKDGCDAVRWGGGAQDGGAGWRRVLQTLRKSLTKVEVAGYVPASIMLYPTDFEGIELAVASVTAIEHLSLPALLSRSSCQRSRG